MSSDTGYLLNDKPIAHFHPNANKPPPYNPLHTALPILNPHHLILPTPISAPPLPFPNQIPNPFIAIPPLPLPLRRSGSTPTKRNRPQFPPPTSPHAPADHQADANGLQRPPQPVPRDGFRVQRGDEQMDDVEREGEIEDELRAGDEQEEGDDSVLFSPQQAKRQYLWG